jgi:hypothetical protein
MTTTKNLTMPQMNNFIMNCVNGVDGSVTDMNGNILTFSKVRKNIITINPPVLTEEGAELRKHKMKQEALRVRKNELQQMRRIAAAKALEEKEAEANKEKIVISSSEDEGTEDEGTEDEEESNDADKEYKEYQQWKKEQEEIKKAKEDALALEAKQKVIKPKKKKKGD